MANIKKWHFWRAGSRVGVRSVFSRSSLGGRRQGIREVKEIGILRKVLFAQAQVVSLKRGDGSGAAVAAHGVSGGEGAQGEKYSAEYRRAQDKYREQ